MITNEGRRIGGRGMADVRTITCEVGLLPRVHGSALFTAARRRRSSRPPSEPRGRAARRDAHRHGLQEVHAALQLPALLGGRGEVPARPGPARDRPRRARRARPALRHAPGGEVPVHGPYRRRHHRVERSSSMASVCGGCLSLMDAGSPSRPGGGDRDGPHQGGREDSPSSPTSWATRTTSATWTSRSAGPPRGCTSIQMDIKIGGVTREILERASAGPRRPPAHPRGDAEVDPEAAHRHQPVRAADHHHPDPAGADQGHHRPRRQDHQGHHRPAPGPRSTSEDDGASRSRPRARRRSRRRSR